MRQPTQTQGGTLDRKAECPESKAQPSQSSNNFATVFDIKKHKTRTLSVSRVRGILSAVKKLFIFDAACWERIS